MGENRLEVEYDMRGFLGRPLDYLRRLLDAMDDFAAHVFEFTENPASVVADPMRGRLGYGCDLVVLLAGVTRDLGVVWRFHDDSSAAVVEFVVGLGSPRPSGGNRPSRSRRPECGRHVYGARARQP